MPQLTPFTLGPVELDVIALEGDLPTPGVLSALAAQTTCGAIRVVDLVLIHRSRDGRITLSEVDAEEYGLAGFELAAVGLTAEEDLRTFAQLLPLGSSAAVVALELLWASELAWQLAATGARLLTTERIPASVVNSALETVLDE
jgi:hypothetical protein